MKNHRLFKWMVISISALISCSVYYYYNYYNPYLSPDEAFKNFYAAAKQKKYSKASNYISSKLLKTIGPQEFSDRWQDYIAKMGNISDYVTIEGESATVKFNFRLNEAGEKRFHKPVIVTWSKNKDGKKIRKITDDENGLCLGEVIMLQENGRWKVNSFHKTYNVTYNSK